VPTGVGPSGKLGEQTGLADPRLADQLDRRRPAPLQLVESAIERSQRRGAPNELGNRHGDLLPRRA
jgi:hypothetical protein